MGSLIDVTRTADRLVVHSVDPFQNGCGAVLVPSRVLVWMSILIGSTIGGIIPAFWHAGIFSYSSLLLSGAGALIGLWIAYKI
jgi:hypothetical protein